MNPDMLTTAIEQLAHVNTEQARLLADGIRVAIVDGRRRDPDLGIDHPDPNSAEAASSRALIGRHLSEALALDEFAADAMAREILVHLAGERRRRLSGRTIFRAVQEERLAGAQHRKEPPPIGSPDSGLIDFDRKISSEISELAKISQELREAKAELDRLAAEHAAAEAARVDAAAHLAAAQTERAALAAELAELRAGLAQEGAIVGEVTSERAIAGSDAMPETAESGKSAAARMRGGRRSLLVADSAQRDIGRALVFAEARARRSRILAMVLLLAGLCVGAVGMFFYEADRVDHAEALAERLAQQLEALLTELESSGKAK